MSGTKTLIQQYFQYQQDIEAKYGEKSLVLMMVGSFYEVYGLEVGQDKVSRRNTVKCEEQVGNLEQVSKLLGIIMTKKSKDKPLGSDNPYMCGFPTYAMPRHLAKLLNARYTVAIYDQFDSTDPRKEKERRLTNIYSPSTYISDEIETNNILLACYLECFICPITKTRRMTLSAAHIDLSTGTAGIYEYIDDQDHPNHVKQELYKLLHNLDPSEIIFINPNDQYDKDFIYTLQQNTKYMYHNLPYDKKYHDSVYQEAFLCKLYQNKTKKDKIKPESWNETIGISNSDLSACFIQLLQFAYEHDPHIVEKICIPDKFHDNEILYMNQDALYNLNLLPCSDNQQITSCFDIVNKTKTKMGERLLRFRIARPITNSEELEQRYNMIDIAKPYHRDYSMSLKKIIDIDRKYRKMILNRITISDFAQLHMSFQESYDIFMMNNNIFGIADCKKISKMLNYVKTKFDIEKMLDHDLNNKDCFILRSIDKNIDILDDRVKELNNIFSSFSVAVNHFGNNNSIRASFNIHPDKQGLCVITTTKRAYDQLKSLDWTYQIKYSGVEKPLTFKLKDLVIDGTSQNNIKLRSRLLDKLASSFEKSKQQLNERINAFFNNFIKQYVEQYDSLVHTISRNIAQIDVAVSSAIVSIENYYTRPTLIESSSSSFNIIGLRHPIIERISDTTEYITNDVNLDSKNLGILLYGLNSAGKSSLLRAIGINIAMAQSGLYCSCDMIQLKPYSELFTKIGANDNLFKGQSTFVVEMYCLRDMLSQSGKHSLILCDELTAGTENTSATGIVAGSIKILLKRSVQFIFTTHLHGLVDFQDIVDNSKLSVLHFAVTIDRGQIIQNRKLEKGSGSSEYGIEIADALGLPKEFIKSAYEYRQKYQGNGLCFLSNKRSRYNSKVIVDHCTECGARPSENSSDYLHVHHIAEQSTADETGKIHDKPFHKNITHNLMVLCEKCHQKVHQQTSDK